MKFKVSIMCGLLSCLGISQLAAQNPIIKTLFTADPAPIVYHDTVFLYTGHDTASVTATNYKMPDWHVFSSTDMVNWKDYGALLSPQTFSWATGDAYAAQCIERNGKFYWFVSTFHKKDSISNGGACIGVAVSDRPTGPFKDAIGKALTINEMTTDMKYGWDDIDPTVFIDDDGQAYLFWGNGSCKWVKLKENMIELDGPITTFRPLHYIEGPWVYKRKGLYYLVYASAGTKPEMIEYCTATNPAGPWEYKGIIQENVPNSFTTHPGLIDFKGKSYFFYHNGTLPTGGSYRRSICVDYMYYNEDGTIQKIIQTTTGVEPVKSKPGQSLTYTISSPDKNILVTCDIGKAIYRISYKGMSVLSDSKLGLTREDGDFSQGLQVIKASLATVVKDQYTMLTAKKKNISYTATRRVIETQIATGKKMNIIFQVSNDGVAFRYEFPGKSTDIKKITAEATSFHFNEGTRAWLQPKTEAQSGFEHSNPSYEAHYSMDIPTGTPSPGKNGWIYPALFKYNDAWILITEAALGRSYCGTALQQDSPDNEYKINFPEAPEVFTNGKATLNPESTLPWKTPWRIIVIGSLNTIANSTLGTDLALPAKKMDASFIKPGKSSWSWIIEKDDSTIFRVQKKYIDFAANMKWQYCLVDANWDATIGYDSIKTLSSYAKQKNVGLLLWYNSAGSWNTVKFTPKDKLLTHETRMAEFSRLQAMGIKGIKVDFFAGDGQSMINYYQDILDDAATNHLLVNFHGATLPRGLHRTYPNLVTTEAVFGYEMITFGQQSANLAPSHSVMCAFVRNAFDPMDFTPMNLYKIPRIKRVTTSAFELATAVVFLSGIQHYAETPDGMAHVPDYVKDFLRQLPNSWDDVKYIDGYPGKLYVVARKAGNKWYVAGINGENIAKELSLDISFLKNKKGQIITAGDSNTESLFDRKPLVVPVSGKLNITLKGNDGFVAVFD